MYTCMYCSVLYLQRGAAVSRSGERKRHLRPSSAGVRVGRQTPGSSSSSTNPHRPETSRVARTEQTTCHVGVSVLLQINCKHGEKFMR